MIAFSLTLIGCAVLIAFLEGAYQLLKDWL